MQQFPTLNRSEPDRVETGWLILSTYCQQLLIIHLSAIIVLYYS